MAAIDIEERTDEGVGVLLDPQSVRVDHAAWEDQACADAGIRLGEGAVHQYVNKRGRRCEPVTT